MAPDFSFGHRLPESPTFLDEEQDGFGFDQTKLMSNNQFSNQFEAGMGGNGIDPNALNMNMNGFNPNVQQNFGIGSGAIQDDDLDFLEEEMSGNGNGNQQFFQGSNGMMMGQNANAAMYSHTPGEAPINSPFTGGFNYNQYNMPLPNDFQRVKMERNSSDGRVPMTPKTPAIGNLQIGTPESMKQVNLNQQLHNQARMQANAWNGTPGSGQSFFDSPLASPHNPLHQPNIHEVMQSRASVPAKLEGGHSSSLPAMVSQEAKKKRRRESHNLVERRRRDNINERIQDLSKLVPSHRLEDEKVRKHITANGPMSPHGASPPGSGYASSGLAPANGRRATAGTITQGLPQEEKEKGPNKGDILNGAVAWMRDLMWHSHRLQQRLEQLESGTMQMTGSLPYEIGENEHRMASELNQIMQRTGPSTFSYTRFNGSQLRVPGFTDYAGSPVSGKDGIKLEDTDLWLNNGGDSGRNSMSIKEEDEEDLSMDMN